MRYSREISDQTTPPSHRLFRGTTLVFALMLGCQAIWILTPEYYQPYPIEFPRNVEAANAARANRDTAELAASFGLIRGDLWANYALTYSDELWGNDHASTQPPNVTEQARDIANRALSYAPYDARIWLLLAGIDLRFDWLNRKSSAELRMSYYTGANDIELIPLRLSLAVNSSEIGDTYFQELVRHDIRIVVTRRPELRPTILAAYQDAPQIGRQFIKETLNGIDPALLAELGIKD